jgi:uncharacterized membrane protein HdeD (DUF308 family)
MWWIRGVIGVLLILIGLVWVGQGIDLITDSPVMSGKPLWAVIGLVVLVVGIVLLRTALRSKRRVAAGSG